MALVSNCPPQIEQSEQMKSIASNQENQAVIMQVLLIFAVLIFLLVQFDRSTYYMVQMIRALLLVTHLPLF